MRRLFILLIMVIFLSSCVGLEVREFEDQKLDDLLELAEGAEYDSTMTGAEVQAELDRCAGRNTTVGDPGSDAELTTEQAQREALNTKQPLEATLTDIADGIVNENLDFSANPMADNEVTNDLTLDLLKLSVLTSAPASPVAGRIYYADNSTWDPCDIAGTDNYYCIYDGAAYIAVMDEDGTFFISSIELPSYTHWATGDATYNDTTTPHVLTSEEMKGGLISNAGASQDKVYTCQPAAFGMNFPVQVIAAFQMDLEPASGEALWLNGTQMAANEHIQNTADTKGDIMSCWSVESGDGTYEIFCKSDNANWVEATP